jgi:hypothetical protein
MSEPEQPDEVTAQIGDVDALLDGFAAFDDVSLAGCADYLEKANGEPVAGSLQRPTVHGSRERRDLVKSVEKALPTCH